MLGVAQTTYSQYELEKRPMPIDYLVALCKFYNVSADYMLGLSDKKIDNTDRLKFLVIFSYVELNHIQLKFLPANL